MHFTVAVFTEKDGPSAEALLEPYSSHYEVDPYPYMTKRDLIKRQKDYFERYKKDSEHKQSWSDEDFYQEAIADYKSDDSIIITDDGDLWSTYNNDAEWDWYQVGGRWSGMLKLKECACGRHGERSWTNKDKSVDDTRADIALVKDVDFGDKFITYAVIMPDGEWYSCDCIHDTSTDEGLVQSATKYKSKFLDTENPEWTIAIIDCHI